MKMATVTENLFALLWSNLKSLSFHCRPTEINEDVDTFLNGNNLLNLFAFLVAC